MMYPRVEPTDAGVAFVNLAPPFVMMLLELPELLAPEQPDEVKRRLYPAPSDDAAHQEEWERLVHPELFSLVASARDIVRRDLAGLRPEGTGAWRVEIPREHVAAWISALNTARLTLGATHGVEEEEDLHPVDDDEEVDEKRLAVVKIHVLGELQALLVLDYCPPPEDEEEEAEEDPPRHG